ncbi:hypothetical protein DAEQUDRAFT_94000 [Daedalea quercina L-15889]|uniref:Uncharacterized protein n=1 Tax=Daedalea quercina L-15889 TaxID=1314783 RepID=A0A165SA16_9APHY|nr:hypothetical protein DAEQUDRAFT_94000 [Daedalea quercina L-15889]
MRPLRTALSLHDRSPRAVCGRAVLDSTRRARQGLPSKFGHRRLRLRMSYAQEPIYVSNNPSSTYHGLEARFDVSGSLYARQSRAQASSASRRSRGGRARVSWLQPRASEVLNSKKNAKYTGRITLRVIRISNASSFKGRHVNTGSRDIHGIVRYCSQKTFA